MNVVFLVKFLNPPFHTDSHPRIRIGGPVDRTYGIAMVGAHLCRQWVAMVGAHLCRQFHIYQCLLKAWKIFETNKPKTKKPFYFQGRESSNIN